MSPVLSAVPVMCPVTCGTGTPAGMPGARDTLTVASRADTLAKLVETPAQASVQLNEAVFYSDLRATC